MGVVEGRIRREDNRFHTLKLMIAGPANSANWL